MGQAAEFKSKAKLRLTMATPNLQRFCDDPDQTARRAELTAFFGPNADGFLAVYDRMVAAQRRGLADRLRPWVGGGFCAPAFFLGFVWFYYRRMWAWAMGFVALMIVLEWVPGTSQVGLVLAIGMALVARRLYVGHAIGTICRLRALTPPPEQGSTAFLDALRSAGGVSKSAGWISGGLFVLVTVIAVVRAL